MEIDPTLPAENFHVGRVLGMLGRDEEAAAAFEQVAQLDPKAGSAYEAWGQALCRLGRQQEAEAVALRWRKALPDDANARHMLAA